MIRKKYAKFAAKHRVLHIVFVTLTLLVQLSITVRLTLGSPTYDELILMIPLVASLVLIWLFAGSARHRYKFGDH